MDPNGFYSFDQNSLPQHAVTDFSVPDERPIGLDPLFDLPGYQPFDMSTLPQIPDGNIGSGQPFAELPDGPLDPLFGIPSYLSSTSSVSQPANNAFTLDRGGLGSDHFGTFNQNSGSFDRAMLGLNDYQPVSQIGASGTTQFGLGPFNSNMAFGTPYSFNQMTLPMSPATYMFAPNASLSTAGFYSVDQNVCDGTPAASGSVIDATPLPSESGPLGARPTSSEMLSHDSPLPQAPRPSKFKCDWPGCTSSDEFPDQTSHSQHVSDIHVRDVLQDRSGVCSWPGCTKTKLDTHKKLELHVANIHLEPLLCTIKDCKRTEPFGRKGELDRHLSSVHKRGRTWKCPQKSCERHKKGFPRKDKLDAHIRTRSHGTMTCHYLHCDFQKRTPFMNEAELASHYDKDHGNLECGIGSCKDQTSAFSSQRLSSHLCTDHHAYPWIWTRKMYQPGVDRSVEQFVERSSHGATARFSKDDLQGDDLQGFHLAFKNCSNCR